MSQKLDLKFESLNFFNPGVLIGKLPDVIFEKVKTVVKDPKAKNYPKETRNLVGVIDEEYETPQILELNKYIDTMFGVYANLYGLNDVLNPMGGSLLETKQVYWTNYMQRGEFNPNHNHVDALAAFVLWVEIPYDIEDEKKYKYENPLFPSRTSCFEITYTTMTGKIVHYPIHVDKKTEGKMIMFPGELSHCVYPFFTSDGVRISIAGNIYEKQYFNDVKMKGKKISKEI